MRPECLRKVWLSKFCWLHPRESGLDVVQGLSSMITSPTLRGTVMLWSQQNYCWERQGISSPPGRAAPRDPPERKSVYENE